MPGSPSQLPPPHVAFFGHNVGDAAVRRRATAFRGAGFSVTGFMPRRGKVVQQDWPLVDLGETRDNDYRQRLLSIHSGSRIAARHADQLRAADMIYARNLDMLALASRTRKMARLHTPMIYECLDIHHRLIGPSPTARALRSLEARLLRKCALVVISSPRFKSEYFDRYHPGQSRFMLIENRLVVDDTFAARPAPRRASPKGALRIGWFGNLRCRRSMSLLRQVARDFPEDVEIVLRGYPAPGVFPDFEEQVSGLSNLSYGGRYRAPEDLSELYEGIDLIWAGDWYEAGANSTWLLPNRIYEGGYFATPALAPSGTETERWLREHGGGFFLNEPIEDTLPETIADLAKDRRLIDAMRARLLSEPREAFVEEPGTVQALAALVMAQNSLQSIGCTGPGALIGR